MGAAFMECSILAVIRAEQTCEKQMNHGPHSALSHTPAKHSRQISLAAMLVLMLIFTLMSAGLFYASRIEEVQTEMAMYFGIKDFGGAGASRKAHLIFLLFTYSSPLMMAMVLSLALNVMKRRA
jgi:hypothetical protein